ncbi:MAG: hypothetical protein JRJ42_01165 [Deltaproteobacteria bacterium]|nr:hypothetical protein [Deltaproteobacteria bacterium]RLB82703.1 MAG: hypothetical protein DRH17_04895 [Deltaproteobacteria bacterium]
MLGFLRMRSSKKTEQENLVFKEKSLHFRERLDRNNKVLETISELTDIKEQQKWISMAGICPKTCTAVNVDKFIESLNHITDGSYPYYSHRDLFAAGRKNKRNLECSNQSQVNGLYHPPGSGESAIVLRSRVQGRQLG